jgi:hypothetical protein
MDGTTIITLERIEKIDMFVIVMSLKAYFVQKVFF